MLSDRRQLPLPFPEVRDFDERDFIAARSNAQALAWLEAEWPDRRLALWGPAGCGKSHLLHVWAHRWDGVLLSGPGLRSLAEIPASGALALDDADLAAPESLLLHVLNTARDRGLRLLVAARRPPARWPVALPDLASRLRAMMAIEIDAPEDDLLAALLVRLFAERQLAVAPALQAWLLARVPRSAGSLRAVVDRLNRVSLSAGRAISRSMIEDALETLALSIEAEDEIFLATADETPQ